MSAALVQVIYVVSAALVQVICVMSTALVQFNFCHLLRFLIISGAHATILSFFTNSCSIAYLISALAF